MAEPQVDDLYRRYAATGDLKALAAVFDALAPDLLRLARRLLRDRTRAEDLVQETFLTALESPESYDPELALQPWLIGILVNRARSERRRARRELDVERLRGGEEPEPVEALAADESRSLIERAIAELPPRLRAVVEGKVLQGRDSLDLAAELDLSHGALRARLHRGLRRLRRALPASLATGLALWFTPSRGLAQVRACVLEEAAKAPAGAAGMGGLLMSKKVVAMTLIAVAAVVAGGFWSAELFGGEREAELSGVELEPLERGERTAGNPPVLQLTPREEIESTARAEVRAGLIVRVTEAGGNTPIEGLNVRVEYRLEEEDTERSARTSDRGVVNFKFDEAVELRVVHVDPGEATTPARSWLRHTLAAGERHALELSVTTGGTLSGRVVDRDGRPVPNAEVFGWHQSRDEPYRRTRADANGAFTLEHLGPSFYATARTPELACEEGVRGDLDPGAHAEGLELRLAPAVSMKGVVLTSDRAPVEGAKLEIWHRLDVSSSIQFTAVPGISTFHAGAGEATSDGQGRFEITDLPARKLYVRVTRAPYLAFRGYADPGDEPVEIELDPGLQLRGRVIDAAGRPAAGARVRFWPCWSNVHTVDCWQVCDESGRFLLPSLVPEEETTIAVLHAGHAVAVVSPVEPGPNGGEYVELPLDPERRITGRVVDGEGRPVSGVRVWVEGERELELGYETGQRHTWEHCAGIDSAKTSEDGTFVLGQLYGGRFTVHAQSPEDDRVSVEREVLSPASDVELVLDPGAMSKVVLAGRVTDALTGEAVERFSVSPADERGWARVHEFEDEEGRFELVGLDAGTLTVSFAAKGYARFELGPRHFEEGRHQLDVALHPARKLALVVRNLAGDPISNAEVEILGPDGRRQWLVDGEWGHSKSRYLNAGRAVLHGLPAARLVVRITVEGEPHEVDVDLTHPLEGELEIVIDPKPSPWLSRATLEMIVLVIAPEIDEDELLQRWQDRQENEERRIWFEERFGSGAIAYVETRVEIEISDATGQPFARTVLTPKEGGGFTEESTVRIGRQEEGHSGELPLPYFRASLPAGSLVLRATVDGYGVVELPLELEADERRSRPLVLRAR